MPSIVVGVPAQKLDTGRLCGYLYDTDHRLKISARIENDFLYGKRGHQ
ncbi:MAG: hypothetical protein HN742_25130 [Lentisphaerae bacterium]|nr:hypothetical protein [Lentisphaerota bacterium]MBT5607565.1 hypothetical protein [Lentisphaerota bacterium]MBT7054574.1 hypothetical protein [Lentisphaerota bacterium]MBT7845186.1 hypothetical protein [Lentisphaerota bacterium]